MRLPQMVKLNTFKETISGFGGINHSLSAPENEFSFMENLSSDNYPIVSQRKKRSSIHQFTGHANGLFSHNKLCWVDGTEFYYDGNEVVGFTLEDSEKKFVGMGAYIVIFPDKKFYNTKDETFGSLENTVTVTNAKLSLCQVDGIDQGAYPFASEPKIPVAQSFWIDTVNQKAYIIEDNDYTQISNITFGASPASPTEGDYWFDGALLSIYVGPDDTWTGLPLVPGTEVVVSKLPPYKLAPGVKWFDTTNLLLKQYSEIYGWEPIPASFIKIEATGIGSGFSVYDGVTLEGVLDGANILYGVGNDYIIVSGILNQATAASVKVSRTVPTMDFVTECNNRLWGCSSTNHEIYACKLGDPKNWNCLMGVSTDSYAVTVGSTGNFTGAATHLDTIMFFKENIIHKIYGSEPSNFRLSDEDCRGVASGSEKSLVAIEGILLYKSPFDICSYNYSSTTSISTNLDLKPNRPCIAGRLGFKYYICVDGELLVYDLEKGLWHREDTVDITYFASHGSNLYFIADSEIYSVIPNSDSISFDWSATTGMMGMNLPNSKYISRLQIRVEAELGSIVKVEIEYDSDGRWIEKCRINSTKLASFTASIVPKRCDHFRLRFSGSGDSKIYSITKTIEQGRY